MGRPGILLKNVVIALMQVNRIAICRLADNAIPCALLPKGRTGIGWIQYDVLIPIINYKPLIQLIKRMIARQRSTTMQNGIYHFGMSASICDFRWCRKSQTA